MNRICNNNLKQQQTKIINWEFIKSYPFPHKLWIIVHLDYTSFITWNSDGTSIIIELWPLQEYLLSPLSIFKLKSLKGFLKHLKSFQFVEISKDLLENDYHQVVAIYKNDYFIRNRSDLVVKVRKRDQALQKLSTLLAKSSIDECHEFENEHSSNTSTNNKNINKIKDNINCEATVQGGYKNKIFQNLNKNLDEQSSLSKGHTKQYPENQIFKDISHSNNIENIKQQKGFVNIVDDDDKAKGGEKNESKYAYETYPAFLQNLDLRQKDKSVNEKLRINNKKKDVSVAKSANQSKENKFEIDASSGYPDKMTANDANEDNKDDEKEKSDFNTECNFNSDESLKIMLRNEIDEFLLKKPEDKSYTTSFSQLLDIDLTPFVDATTYLDPARDLPLDYFPPASCLVNREIIKIHLDKWSANSLKDNNEKGPTLGTITTNNFNFNNDQNQQNSSYFVNDFTNQSQNNIPQPSLTWDMTTNLNSQNGINSNYIIPDNSTNDNSPLPVQNVLDYPLQYGQFSGEYNGNCQSEDMPNSFVANAGSVNLVGNWSYSSLDNTIDPGNYTANLNVANNDSPNLHINLMEVPHHNNNINNNNNNKNTTNNTSTNDNSIIIAPETRAVATEESINNGVLINKDAVVDTRNSDIFELIYLPTNPQANNQNPDNILQYLQQQNLEEPAEQQQHSNYIKSYDQLNNAQNSIYLNVTSGENLPKIANKNQSSQMEWDSFVTAIGNERQSCNADLVPSISITPILDATLSNYPNNCLSSAATTINQENMRLQQGNVEEQQLVVINNEEKQSQKPKNDLPAIQLGRGSYNSSNAQSMILSANVEFFDNTCDESSICAHTETVETLAVPLNFSTELQQSEIAQDQPHIPPIEFIFDPSNSELKYVGAAQNTQINQNYWQPADNSFGQQLDISENQNMETVNYANYQKCDNQQQNLTLQLSDEMGQLQCHYDNVSNQSNQMYTVPNNPGAISNSEISQYSLDYSNMPLDQSQGPVDSSQTMPIGLMYQESGVRQVPLNSTNLKQLDSIVNSKQKTFDYIQQELHKKEPFEEGMEDEENDLISRSFEMDISRSFKKARNSLMRYKRHSLISDDELDEDDDDEVGTDIIDDDSQISSTDFGSLDLNLDKDLIRTKFRIRERVSHYMETKEKLALIRKEEQKRRKSYRLRSDVLCNTWGDYLNFYTKSENFFFIEDFNNYDYNFMRIQKYFARSLSSHHLKYPGQFLEKFQKSIVKPVDLKDFVPNFTAPPFEGLNLENSNYRRYDFCFMKIGSIDLTQFYRVMHLIHCRYDGEVKTLKDKFIQVDKKCSKLGYTPKPEDNSIPVNADMYENPHEYPVILTKEAKKHYAGYYGNATMAQLLRFFGAHLPKFEPNGSGELQIIVELPKVAEPVQEEPVNDKFSYESPEYEFPTNIFDDFPNDDNKSEDEETSIDEFSEIFNTTNDNSASFNEGLPRKANATVEKTPSYFFQNLRLLPKGEKQMDETGNNSDEESNESIKLSIDNETGVVNLRIPKLKATIQNNKINNDDGILEQLEAQSDIYLNDDGTDFQRDAGNTSKKDTENVSKELTDEDLYEQREVDAAMKELEKFLESIDYR